MRLVATWWTTGVAALFVLALVSSSACSGNGNGNETEVKDVGDVGDADARIDLDVPPDKESTEIDLKDSGKDEPEGDIPDVPQDEEIMTPPDGEIGEDEVEQPTCELPCAEIGDCEGKFPDVDKCHVEICIPDEICAAKNPGMLGKCELIKKDPLCCIKNEQCMDDNICTINEKCVNNLCTNELDLTNPACCVNNVLVKLDFENIQTGEMPPAEKAYCTDKQPGDNVICSVQPTPLGGKAVYFGDPVCKTYNSGQMVDCLAVEKIECTEQTQDEDCPAPLADCDNNGDCVPSPKAARVTLELVVPELNLPSDSLLKLTFRYLMKAEEPIPGSLYNFDTLDVFARVAEGGGTEEELAYSSIEFDNDTQGKFVLIAANLTKYAGKSIDLVFRFDTFEGTENDHLGTYIDDITVGTFCSEDTCDKTSDCNDKNVCTADECAEFKNTGGGSLVGVCLNELGDPCCTQCATVDDCAVKCGEPIGECTLAACEAVGAEGKKCVWSPNPECCTQDDLGQYGKQGFESGKLPDQWSVEAQPGNPYKWDVVSTQADPKGGDIYALAFGAGSYDCGQTHCWGKFTTGKFDLTKVSPKAFVKLTFMLRLGTEWDKVDPSEYVPVGIDTLKVFAVTEKDESIQVWSSDVIFGTTGYTQDPKGELPDIRPVWADLTQFTGQKIALRFEFDTGDVNPPANDYYGVLMDELVVESVCEQVCLAAADCVSGGDCMKGKCIDGVCGYDSIPECCTAIYNPKCDDKDACTDDACDVGAKLCSHKYSGAPGCCTAKEQLFYDNFDAPDNAWKVLEPGSPCGDGECEEPESCITCPSDCKVCTVRWQVVDKQAFTPKSSLYFGNTDTWTYFNGAAPAYGKITSAPFQLPPYGIPIVSFMLWLETEHGAQFVEPADFDKLTLYVEWADKVDGPWSPATAAWNSLSW
ncbi:MAG: hypothetical protein FJ109_06525, partial [Deltaproteobacteria bacterium]|nr:hypothetical protein [Deltaproteobacteria bacterium]